MRRRLTAVLPATLINISSKARPLQLFQMFAEVVCSVLACMLLLLFFTAHSRCSILISNYIQTYWQNVWISRILVFRFATVHFSHTTWSFSFAFDWIPTDAKAAVASMGNRCLTVKWKKGSSWLASRNRDGAVQRVLENNKYFGKRDHCATICEKINNRIYFGQGRGRRLLKFSGAYHLARKSGNFGLKSNGKVIFRKFRSEIVEYLQRYSEVLLFFCSERNGRNFLTIC